CREWLEHFRRDHRSDRVDLSRLCSPRYQPSGGFGPFSAAIRARKRASMMLLATGWFCLGPGRVAPLDPFPLAGSPSSESEDWAATSMATNESPLFAAECPGPVLPPVAVAVGAGDWKFLKISVTSSANTFLTKFM